MFAAIADAIARITPEASAVTIFGFVFRLLTHAIDDRDRWRRLMVLVAPLMILFLVLAGIFIWWLLGEGGIQVLLRHFR